MTFASKRDMLFFFSLLPSASILVALLTLILYSIVARSVDAFRALGIDMLLKSMWSPENEAYGILSPVVGTFVVASIAVATSLLFSVPLSVLVVELVHGKLREALILLVELMGGLPTVVYALWSLNFLMPFLRDYVMMPLHAYLGFVPPFSCRPVTGFSVFVAGVAIGISLIPYMASIIIESYRSIPSMYREACLGIGATRYELVRILLSLSKPAIVAAAMLGFARAAGETTIAAVVVGSSMHLSPCIFAPGHTVSALIASQYANAALYRYAEPVLYASSLIVLASALVLSFAGLNVLDKWRVRVVV